MRLINAGTPARESAQVVDRFWTVPNVITLVRFLLVPVFFGLMVGQRFGWALAVLALLGSTDWVDGYVARRLGQVSPVGMILDPLADRLALIIVAIAFVASGIAPLWLILAILVPDAVLLSVSLALFRNHPDLPVSLMGKLRTAILLVGAPLLLLGHLSSFQHTPVVAVALVLLGIGCVGHIVASAGYLWSMIRKFRGRRVADGAA